MGSIRSLCTDQPFLVLFSMSLMLTWTGQAGAANRGVWVKAGPPSQINAYCLQTYQCGPKEDLLHSADTQIVVTKPQLQKGVCSAGGGAYDSCNVCLTNPPTMTCAWELRKKK